MNTILWIINSCGGAILFFFICLLVGSKLLTVLKIETVPEERFIFSAGLGVGITAFLLLIIGFIGLYTKKAIIITAIGIIMLCVFEIKIIIYAIKNISQQIFSKEHDLYYRFCKIMIIFFAALLFIVATSPETEWDAVSFHLATAKIYVQQQQIIPIYYAFHAALPHLFDMLYVIGELWNSDIISRIFVLLCNLTIALGIWMFGKKLFSEKVGLTSALIFLTTPILLVYFPSTYIDIPIGIFALTGIWALWNWKQTKKIKWLWILGITNACLVSSKIVTLPFVIACILYILIEKIRNEKKVYNCWKPIVIIGFCLTIALLPWIIFNYSTLNNPVYPFGEGIFHGKYWSPELAQWWSNSRETYSGGKNLIDFIFKPFILTFMPNTNGPIYGFSPFYLMLIPFIIFWINEKKQELYYIGLIIFFSWTGWFILAPDMRYIFYLFPLLALLAGYGLEKILTDENIKKNTKKIIKLFTVFIILTNLLFFFIIFRNDVQMWTGKITREEFITIDTPNYPVTQWANQNLPKNAFIFLANDDKGYYFEREYITGYGIFSTYVDYAHMDDGEALYNKLKKIGITHVLFKEYDNGNLIGYDNYYVEKTTILFEELKEKYMTPLYEENNIALYQLT
ncbi:MAG: glycosyltransferase family 39 protein [Candidatus Woesearchaeota archaeon]|jgi:hypothetical protein